MEKTDTTLNHGGKHSKLIRIVTEAYKLTKHYTNSVAFGDWTDALNEALWHLDQSLASASCLNFSVSERDKIGML
jgi:hypothetical protein